MSETVFSQALPNEKISIVILLTECGLSIREMNSPDTGFLVAKQEGTIIGCIGLENRGKYGLLHSLAVKRDFRGSGLGRQLYEKITEQSRNAGIEEFYVLTRAAEGLFAKWGFGTIDRGEVPDEIGTTNDFKNDIFSTYTCMKKKLGEEPAVASSTERSSEEKTTAEAEPSVIVVPGVGEKPEDIVAELETVPAAAGTSPVTEPPENVVELTEEPAAAPVTMQEALQELKNLPEKPSVAAVPAAVAEAAAVLMVPCPDVSLSVPAAATLMKTVDSAAAPVDSVVSDTPDTGTPVPDAVPATPARHFAADRLPLLDDMPGARTWGVSLSRTMLKYYEMAPETQLETHSHECEHITMVVEGQLCFGVGETVIPVKEGEMIAIPANVPHKVFTNEQSAKAMEAVSIIAQEGGK